jgi:hypothetical protein
MLDLDPLPSPPPREARAPRLIGPGGPLRFVPFDEAVIAVSEEDHRAAALAVRAALWLVQYWGLVSVDSVAERARALGPDCGASAALVSRLLSAAPRTRWLDWPDRRWFSLATPTSQLAISVRKVLSVAKRVRIEDLRAGLVKAAPAIADAPYSVLEEYLRQIVGCTVDGATAQLATGAPDVPDLSPTEAALVGILEQAGGTMELSALRSRARAARLPEATTRRLLKMSPLFLSMPDRCVRLIGHGPESMLAARSISLRPPAEPPVTSPATRGASPVARGVREGRHHDDRNGWIHSLDGGQQVQAVSASHADR